ncbi:MAG: tRNA 4-thiouridine(8) synthase ThiI [Desulfobacterales bacterium]|nr:tRNA 4-thiouridine(8) synthase ThiI [Desulfobacterales bacterium]
MTSNKKVRALGLSSGGLDSILAALVLYKQRIEIEWITFETPFFSSEKAEKASRITGIPIIIKNITPVYLEMLKNPPCGYGKYMNPCLDCHALMFRLAGDIMKQKGFDFLFSGEVLGQRPMSQTKPSLRYVEKHSGFDGYILRPLSAKKLPETIPEKQGLVNRELLLDISGRSRKKQIKLAEEFGIHKYPAPAGGCLLTDKGYSNRLKDLFEHQSALTEKELELLKYGRHFRVDIKTKIIIGRTKIENQNLIKYYDATTDVLIKVKDFPGPLALLPQKSGIENISLAASLCIGYSKAPNNEPTEVLICTPDGPNTLKLIGITSSEIKGLIL